MSKKHPGRDTEFAKWKSAMGKLDNKIKQEQKEMKLRENQSPQDDLTETPGDIYARDNS